ncbi:hypothetical protein BS47DRAFT_1144129 [Hydnum rufescens UP504]|uniref:NADP-dependent oxidoreductase domain-containing protein n=1 Tax=Hydnum rufescens UP504 TaxID=1448309 RepID=A0A9P6ATY4_9AGAM|nr:hypothetical protein BS47DRAFT_1144129 [Hydnum rufescens UP504]
MPFPSIFLNDGNQIPQLAFGTGSVNKGIDMHTVVEHAIEHGIHHIDTAQAYENEESVGRAIRESGLARSEFYVTTKLNTWRWPKHGKPSALEELRVSLKKLGLTYVDLYLIHSPTPGEDIPAIWRDFEEAKRLGLTKSIGVSNFTVQELEIFNNPEVAKIKPALNQIRLHPYNIAENESLLAFAKQHGLTIASYSTLTPITQLPGGPVDSVIARIAERLGATPAQVIFLWVKAKGSVIVTTTSRSERMDEYVAAGDLPDLTEQDVEAIDKAGAPKWRKWSATAPRFLRREGPIFITAALLFYCGRWLLT